MAQLRGLFLCLLAVIVSHVSALWPWPQLAELGSSSLALSPLFSFSLDANSKQSARLVRGAKRYESLIGASKSMLQNATLGSTVSSCSVSVQNVIADETQEFKSLTVGVDESYTLTVSEAGDCAINANTIWGALHGLETFSQLLVRTASASHAHAYSTTVTSLPVNIEDSPRFTHRGMLIDSSRHYLPMEEIQRIIDTFPLGKMNVLHWHAVDAQSFPLDLPSAPQLAKGAYAPQLIYTDEDVKAITAYAADRGVRVLMEVDVPGHASSWQYGEPDLMADCIQKYTNVNNYALDPTQDRTYEVLNSVLTDLIKPSGAPYFHLGGDEVVYGCWSNDADIVAWMKTNGIASYDALLSYFALKADDLTRALGAIPVHWEEVFKAGVPLGKDVIVEVWTNSSVVSSVVSAGYQVIAAPSDYWYLDHLTINWSTMYTYDPTVGLSSSQAKLIIGGEVGMWGEYVDENNFEGVVYPRALAVAERLWSAANVNDATKAKPRILEQRCRMVQRGFRTAPVEPSFCGSMLV